MDSGKESEVSVCVCVQGRMSETQGGITLLGNHGDYTGEREQDRAHENEGERD